MFLLFSGIIAGVQLRGKSQDIDSTGSFRRLRVTRLPLPEKVRL
jgi:hypothetical protein